MGFRCLFFRLVVPVLCSLLPYQSGPEAQGFLAPEDSTQLSAQLPDAGEVAVEAVVDSSRVPLNRTLTLTVRASCIGDIDRYQFQWPIPPDFDRFDLVGSASANIVRDERDQLLTVKEFKYILQPVGQGQARIGAVTLLYTDKLTQREYSLTTRTIEVEITEPVAGDTGGVLSTLWLLVGLLAVISVCGLVYLRKRRGRKEEAVPLVETKTAEETALEELEKVPELRLAGETKEYYSAISNTLRRYIDRRFSLRTLELTTHDIVNSLRLREVAEETIIEIEKVLNTCDMVKFTRHEPPPSDLDQIYSMAQDFFKNRLQNNSAEKRRSENENPSA